MAKNPFPKAPVRAVRAGGVRFGGGAPLALIAGPCVIESREMALDLAARLSALAKKDRIPFVFKASYDKANRTSVKAFRGPGLSKGLEILAEIKERFGMPILVDVHQTAEVKPAAEVADILQLPAFLCRQTDLAVALGESGRVVNIKKGQFLAPWDMRHVIEKVESTGNRKILLTERGASFGYNNLVADFRSLLIMRQFGYPVVFDATHSVQLPGGREDGTGGDGRWAPYLSRAAAAAGCDGLFWETHRNPPEAKSDKDNALPLAAIGPLWRQCRRMDELA
ncbi:MAG: 3-deoxy-8-phosphooctulonate synthase [Kiritimatiellae bacterium]|jgi:2-dehydro-3-deoxyphosphooctonate aldolase (KDO 8-P synthase)|nr:3-deoxy-8-phosphooctulonate synthase [Kiritimatiellia bacterium]MDD3440307.1 3-deoxy-8-phosphooctulonate synthase [Kiritimatiellia bacterium]MDD4117347.1 3-deoxy-8-phosphooctulonate synthase [Kiritimatiellia bacterium]